jgi:uncharacterized protein (DUF58 family)
VTAGKDMSRPRVFSTMSRGTVIFLVLFVAIALAGFNSGNNLLYLIAGIMLSAIVISIGVGRLNLSHLTIERRLPAYIFANQSIRVVLEVSNRKKHINSYGITIRGGTDTRQAIFIPLLKRNAKLAHVIDVSFERRGRHVLNPITIGSQFPWGLFNLGKKVTKKQEIIVYPPIYEISTVINGSSRIRDEFPQFVKGPGSGLYGVREYRHGEDISNISWKLSAKMDKLIVRETEAEEKRRVCVIFDNFLEGSTEENLRRFENSVSAAASLIWYLWRNGYVLKLVTRDQVIGYGAGSSQMHKMLLVLACIEPTRENKVSPILNKRLFEGGTGVLVQSANPAASVWTAKDFAVVITEGARAGIGHD